MSSNGFSIVRLLVVAAILIVSVNAADAYTLVLRSGRRMEVPNNFVVSGLTLTYEATAGIQVTVQLASIDVSATELANNDLPGSFLKRATSQPVSPTNLDRQQTPANAPRSITNSDLEVYRSARVESERAYELRRKELGLSSGEEVRRTATAETEQTRSQLLKAGSDEQVEENYWRSRAAQLRTERVAIDAQITYLESRLSSTPDITAWGAFPTVFPFPAIVSSRVSPALNSTFVPGPHIIPPAVPVGRSQFGGRAGFGDGRIRGASINPRFSSGPRGGRFFSGIPVLGASLASYAYDGYDRAALINQLDQLRLQRVQLQSHWQILEDDARRAGAYPGWLRP
jgi:hypothetical protein